MRRVEDRFLVLEGLDGSGTTTQAGRVAASLRARDLQVHLTAEPSQGPLGQVLRAHVRGDITLDPLTAALTFTADRADHLNREIRPALADGAVVVCDRYLLSTLAYQGAEGINREWIFDASSSFEIPALTIYLDVPEAELSRRLSERAGEERYEDPRLSEAIRASYEESIELMRARGHVIERIDNTRAAGTVTEDILLRLDALAGKRIYP